MTVTQTTTPPSGEIAAPATAGESGRQFTLNLPFVHIQVRPPELHLPHIELPQVSRRDVEQAVDIARSFLPPPERLAYYGGLGVLAALGVIEWPVAAAIGAGTMIAQRTRAQEQRWSPLRAPEQATTQKAEPKTTGKASTATGRTKPAGK